MEQWLVNVLLFFCIVKATNGVSIIAHMANSPGAVRWAMSQGANGVEMDLQFNGSHPVRFQHSLDVEPCDCSCLCPIGKLCSGENICTALFADTGSHCTASTSFHLMAETLTDPAVVSKLAIIYIDSKLTNSMKDFYGAGADLVRLLNLFVLDQGYRGQIVIDANYIIYSDYLKGALQEALFSPYSDRYFYTFGSERGKSQEVRTSLTQLKSDHIVYLTGISVCVPLTYLEEVKSNVARNQYASVGIWTLDKASSMQQYLEAGVGFIMTNEPRVAQQLIGMLNVPPPDKAFIPKSVDRPTTLQWKCECTYHKGGCTISRSAPPHSACKCSYKGAWTCDGQTVACANPYLHVCLNPDASKEACIFGGGDCGGY